MHPYVEEIQTLFLCHRNGEQAEPMQAYMQHRFKFLGIKASQRNPLQAQLLSRGRLPDLEALPTIVKQLWEVDFREFQYFGVDLLKTMQRRLPEEFIGECEALITTKSWWDTVDALASHGVGSLLARFPQAREPWISRWRQSENLWLRRTTLLFQLRYKTNTDADLLFELIHENKHSDEFFLRKAIGWALREYSKVQPRRVEEFVLSTDLSGLSRREALKWMIAKGLLQGPAD